MEKKEVREEEKSSSTVGPFVLLDNVSSSRSGHLKSDVGTNRSRSVKTLRSFNQLICNHLKDFILDDI